jgi:glycosyltransferase involved in cell wall biosynthesis
MDYPVRKGPLARWLYGKKVAATVVISEAVAREIVEAGVPRERLHLIHEGVDPEPTDLQGRRRAARSRLAISSGALVAVCAASLRPRKGQRHLLAAFAGLANEFPGAVLVLAGDGSERQLLVEQVTRLGLEGRVLLPGQLPSQDCLAIADLACIPSLREGLSVFSLEAQAAGLPVLASRVGGLPEAVADEVTGLLAAPGDEHQLATALRRLLADAGLRQRLGAAGRQRVRERFSARAMAEQTEKLYERLLREAPDS